jgi:hypothetical protein
MGIDIGKNSFHVVGLDRRGAIVLRQKWSRGQIETRFAAMPPWARREQQQQFVDLGQPPAVGSSHPNRRRGRRSGATRKTFLDDQVSDAGSNDLAAILVWASTPVAVSADPVCEPLVPLHQAIPSGFQELAPYDPDEDRSPPPKLPLRGSKAVPIKILRVRKH